MNDDPNGRRRKAAIDAVLADPEQHMEFLSGGMPIAARTAVADRLAETASPAIAARFCRALLHPAASTHWDDAIDLAADLALTEAQVVAALDALAASSPGTGRAN